MKPLTQLCHAQANHLKQRGVVLFFALIALVVMSLAAVALIRSVDTSTVIAGNLAFKQAATSSGDIGVDAAITWMSATQLANAALNVYVDPAHTFNVTDATVGYYSNADPALNLFDNGTWDAITGVAPVTDTSGNTTRYIVQRMCRTANAVLSTTNCLFGNAAVDSDGQNVKLPQDICSGAGCPTGGQTSQYRITARIQGPKNTISFIQAFVF